MSKENNVISLPDNGEIRALLDVVKDDESVNENIDNAVDKYNKLSMGERVKVGEFAVATAVKLLATNDRSIDYGAQIIDELNHEKAARTKAEEKIIIYEKTLKQIKDNNNKCDEKIVNGMCSDLLVINNVKKDNKSITVSGKDLNRMAFLTGMKYNKTPDDNKHYSIKKDNSL